MFDRWIATPLAASAGIKTRVHLRVEDNPILEAYFTSQGKNPPQVNPTFAYKILHSLSLFSFPVERKASLTFRDRISTCQNCDVVIPSSKHHTGMDRS